MPKTPSEPVGEQEVLRRFLEGLAWQATERSELPALRSVALRMEISPHAGGFQARVQGRTSRAHELVRIPPGAEG